MRLAVPLFLSLFAAHAASAGESFVVHATDVADRKAVVATVEPIHQLVGRARIGGTLASLTIKEGDVVAAGAEIAVVTDQKLALQMQALDSRIASQQSQRDQAKIDYDRIAELQKRGHKVEMRNRYSSGAAPVLIRLHPSGLIEAGADPFLFRSAQAW